MEDYKVSRFIKVAIHDGYYLLFHALSGEILKVQKNKTTDQFFQDESLNFFEVDNNCPLQMSLINYGCFVKADTNEGNIAQLYYDNNFYSNQLKVVLLVSENCNFRCKYCYDEFDKKNISNTVSNAFISYIRKNINSYTGLNISWFGGEPLLAKNEIINMSEQLIDICKKTSRRYVAGITTNGYLLDLDTFSELLHHKVLNYQITLDGLADTHDFYRPCKDGSPSFSTIIHNLCEIKNKIRSSSFTITIRTNFTKKTICNINKYIEYMETLFGDDNRFSFLFRPVGNWGGERVDEISDQLLPSISKIYNAINAEKFHLNLDINVGLMMATASCEYSKRNSISIDTDGIVYTCPQIKYVIGKLLPNGFMDLDKEAIARWNYSKPHQNSKCWVCPEYALCKGRQCPARLISNPNSISPHCGYESFIYKDLLILLDKSNSRLIKTLE